jgi:hypothetical protein
VRLRLCLGKLLFLLALCSTLSAKDKQLIGIILYDTPNGPAYVQAADIVLNGKDELYTCQGNETFDNGTYKKLSKAKLVGVQSMERDASGIIRMTSAGGTTCVVPQNLKLEKRKNVTVSELADMALVGGRWLSKSPLGVDAMPVQFPIGMKIVFVPAPDPELAEFLRVTRKPSIALLQEYFGLYPAAAHTTEIKNLLAGMITMEGEAALQEHRKTVESKTPDYPALRRARDKAIEARKVVPGFTRADKLLSDINSLMQGILEAGKSEVGLFNHAVAERKAGYIHLQNAQKQVANARLVDPAFANLERLNTDVETQIQLVERATAQGEGFINESKFDEGYRAVARYASLAGELPRISAVIDAAAHSHRDKGLDLVKESRWEDAIGEFRRALEYKEEAETRASLRNAEAELQTVNDKLAAQVAIEKVGQMAAAKQFIEAYETLNNLPEGQRKFVVDELDKLRGDYLTDLVTRSNELTSLHIPINGRADEDAVRQAYDFLQKASKLTEDDNITVKLDLVSEKISEYYLSLANRQLEKPRGSGVALGWHLLLEGQHYKRDQEMLRNQITKYAPAYDTRGKMSIAVQFRDQTSRRDSLGFADQMADTIASRLEAAGFRGVHVLTRDRIPSAVDPNAAQPNFQIIGDIMQHRVEKKVDTQRLNSKYRAGTREVRNPAWLEANRLLETMKAEYQRMLENSRVVVARNKKKEIEQMNRQLEDMNRQMGVQKSKLDAIPETLLSDIIASYNYTKRTFTLNATVEVAFRAADPSAQLAAQSDSVKVELPKTVDILENVKAEDTEGIVEEGSPPDEIQLLAEAETQAQSAMIKKIMAWIENVPAKVFADARAAMGRQDKEAAAERYVLYLNITPEKESPERTEALTFLRNEFNVTSVTGQ